MITFLLAIIALLLGMIVFKLYPTLFPTLIKMFFFAGLLAAVVTFAVYSDPSLEAARMILQFVAILSLSYAFSYLIHKLSGADNLLVYLVGITLAIAAIVVFEITFYETFGEYLLFNFTD
ncbi:hypothetical protein N9X77_04150 [Luminiphilus sp.]|nr:hypothetical protein [Luminiphilus sp.]